MLVLRQRRVLAGGAARDEEVRSLVDLEVDEALEGGFVDRAVGFEWRDQGHAEAAEVSRHCSASVSSRARARAPARARKKAGLGLGRGLGLGWLIRTPIRQT
jgi:hypothetical protein